MGNSERKSSAKSAPGKSSRTLTELVDIGSGGCIYHQSCIQEKYC